MRKYVIGIVIGISLSFAVSAHAAVENIIGRVVEGVFPVKVNGAQIEKQAIVIDGTSYLPVRAIGDALGMDISFDADLGIGLTQKITQLGGGKMSEASVPVPAEQIKPVHFLKVNLKLDKETSKENGEFGLIEAGGKQYVPLAALSGPYTIDWKEPNATFHKEGVQDIVITIAAQYQSSSNGFMSEGSAYVDLSLLGLKAAVQGEILVVSKQ